MGNGSNTAGAPSSGLPREVRPTKSTAAVIALVTAVAVAIAGWRHCGDPGSEALSSLRRGEGFEGAGQHQEALDDYRRALSLSPNSYDVHLAVGRTLLRMERYSQSREAILEGLRLREAKSARLGREDSGGVLELTEALVGLGDCELHLDRPHAALKAYEESLTVLETDEGVCGRARALSRTGRYEEAANSLNEYLTRNAVVRPYLVWAEILKEEGRIDQAISKLIEAERRIPDSSMIQYQLGLLLEGANRKDEAVSRLHSALSLWDSDWSIIRPAKVEVQRVLFRIEHN